LSLEIRNSAEGRTTTKRRHGEGNAWSGDPAYKL